MLDLSFYKNKKVLITGHTGFKGTWLSKILINLAHNGGDIRKSLKKDMDEINQKIELLKIKNKQNNFEGDNNNILEWNKLPPNMTAK